MLTALLIIICAQDALVLAKKQPAPETEEGVVRATAVQFDFKSFDAKAAARWRPGYRRGIPLGNGERVWIVFQRPTVDAGSVSWTGRVERSALPPGVTLVVQGAVVSAHFALDDGRRFEIITRGRQVWLRQMQVREMREAAPRMPPPGIQ